MRQVCQRTIFGGDRGWTPGYSEGEIWQCLGILLGLNIFPLRPYSSRIGDAGCRSTPPFQIFFVNPLGVPGLRTPGSPLAAELADDEMADAAPVCGVPVAVWTDLIRIEDSGLYSKRDLERFKPGLCFKRGGGVAWRHDWFLCLQLAAPKGGRGWLAVPGF